MTGIEICNILSIAEQEIENACKLDGRGRTGGYLCVMDQWGAVFVCQIGVITDPLAAVRYRDACQEKATRLISNGHLSSWESRNVEAKMYGGGVRACDDIAIAFSGLTEHLDEAYASMIAAKIKHRMSSEAWTTIRGISQNPYMTTYGWVTSVAV